MILALTLKRYKKRFFRIFYKGVRSAPRMIKALQQSTQLRLICTRFPLFSFSFLLETRNIILTIKNKMRTEYKIYSIHYACVSMCLCIHVFVWVLGGVGECLGVYEKFCYKNFGRPWRGRGGGFWETFGQPRTDGGGGV